MAYQEALVLTLQKYASNSREKPSSIPGMRYLFECYKRIEAEERQYPKVMLLIIINYKLVLKIIYFIVYRGIVLL